MSFNDLKPHEQLVYDAMHRKGCRPRRTADNCIRSGCPAHGGDDENCTAYLNADGVAFFCYSHGCTHEAIRDALELTQTQIVPGRHGLSLLEYAIAKKLPPTFLFEHGVRQIDGRKYPHLVFNYLGYNGEPLCERYRESIDGKVLHKLGNTQRAYGLWEILDFLDYLVFVEGESDWLTLRFHGIGAIGIPGANCVKAVLSDLEEVVKRRPDLRLYIFQEPDTGGAMFVKSFELTSFKDRLKVISLETFKDPSGLHCHKPEEFIGPWTGALFRAISWTEHISSSRGKPLVSLAPCIRETLKKKLTRSRKEEICTLIGDLLIVNDRLICDTAFENDPVPYMLTDEGSVVAISTGVRSLYWSLMGCGMNPQEEIFGWTINDLKYKAIIHGRKTKLQRYSVIRNGKLYISSGTSEMVVVEVLDNGTVEMNTLPNGTDGILFAAESCFPKWEPAPQVQSPLEACHALRPELESPDEALGYTPKRQMVLFEAWLIARIAGVRAPILTCFGSMSNGKSVTLRAVVRLFMGVGQDISNPPSNTRSFWTAATNLPLYAIDNLDCEPQSWFEDAIAAACTGVSATDRKLFKDSELFCKPVTANFGITTRTAAFAGRPDIQDRVLPLFFGVLKDTNRVDESELFDEISAARNGLFTYFAERAAIALLDGTTPKGKAGRFQAFSQIADSLVDFEEEGEAWKQCEIAKRLSIADNDALTIAVRSWFEKAGGNTLEGKAMEVCDKLRQVDQKLQHKLPQTPKGFSIRLREAQPSLEAMGYQVSDSLRGNSKYYKIAKL